MAITSKIRRHKIMEQALRDIMGSNLPPSFKCGDTYDSIVFPQGYTVPSYDTVIGKFYELLALEPDYIKTTFKGDLEVGTANLYVDVSESSVGIGTPTPSATLQVVGNAHVSSNLQVDQVDLFVNPDSGNLGIGVTGSTTNLHVDGNVYISSNLEVGRGNLFFESSTGKVGVGTTTPGANLHVESNVYFSNLKVGTGLLTGDGSTSYSGELVLGGSSFILPNSGANFQVRGNAYVSSNLKIGNSSVFYADPSTGKVGINTATPEANLHVEGNVYASSNLQVGTSNLFVDTSAGNVGIGISNPDTELCVKGPITRRLDRHIFDFENKRPKYISSNDEFRYVAMRSQNGTMRYVIPNSGTTVYSYNPSTDTTTTVVSTTTSDDTTGPINITAGLEYYADGPFIISGSSSGDDNVMASYSDAGYYFGYSDRGNGSLTRKIFVYAPYGDVTINEYVNRSIKDAPSNIRNITKQTLTEFTTPATAGQQHAYTLEAEDGVILVSSQASNGRYESFLYPGSDLSYILTGKYRRSTNNDIFNESYNTFSQSTICTSYSVYSPAGIPSFKYAVDDGDGESAISSIPYELLGDTYYVGHSIPGFTLGFLYYPQTVTASYHNGTSWVQKGTYSSNNCKINPYNPWVEIVGRNGGFVDIGQSFSGSAATATLWRFTSNRKFVLKVELSGADEYYPKGWLNPSNQTKLYRLPYSYAPSIYKVYLAPGINVYAGTKDQWYTTYNVFGSGKDTSFNINSFYGAGFSFPNNYTIKCPDFGFYRATLHMNFITGDYPGSDPARVIPAIAICPGLVGPDNSVQSRSGYARVYGNLKYISTELTTILSFYHGLSTVYLAFKRETTTTVACNTAAGSFLLLERIG
jgi:hypothetical protein